MMQNLGILKVYLEEQLLLKYYVKILEHDGYQRGLASIAYKFLDERSALCAH